MKSLVQLITLACLLTGSIDSQGQNPNPNSALDAYIQGEMTNERFPGVATVIVKNGEIVWLETYGFADVANNIPVEDTTVFLLASLSKVFTGTAVMQLYENGQIDLDEDINRYLPWTIDVPGHESDSITFRQLMTHTASVEDNGPVMDTYYDYPDPSITLADCMQRYFSTAGSDYDAVGNFFTNAPGTLFSYSNMGTALDGYLVEAVSGTGFDQFCKDNIFDPLCMNKTAWFMADFDSSHVARPYQYSGGSYMPYNHYGFADYPDGQLRSNVLDLARFMVAYLNGGTLGANSILTSNSVNEMWSTQIPALNQQQGLNWYEEELFHTGGTSWLWGHNGGENGVSTDMYLDPVNNIGLCVLTNGEGDALYICDELYDFALGLTPTSSIPVDCAPVGIASQTPNEIAVFPNPAGEQVTFDLTSIPEATTIILMDAPGKRLIEEVSQPAQQHTMQLNLPKGLYFYLLNDLQGNVLSSGKLIIE